MAQLALGAIGAVVGTFIAPGVGTSIGWALGSAVGGYIEAANQPATHGPRLTDLSSQISSYGVPIPRIYGQVGGPGNVIWALPLRQVATETGGKGGAPSVVEYTYFATFALLLCEGEVSLKRLWIQGKCLYDVRDETNLAAMIASGEFAQYFTFYTGSETQLPDPTMEATLGVGNVPAYLGSSYIVFHDLPVGQFGNSPVAGLAIIAEVVHNTGGATGLRVLAAESSGFESPAGGSEPREIYPVTNGVVRIGGGTADDGVNVYAIDGASQIFQDYGSEQELARPGVDTDPVDSTLAGGAVGNTGIRTLFPSGQAFNSTPPLIYIGDSTSNTPLATFFPPTDTYRGVIPCADGVHFLVAHATAAAPTVFLYKMFSYSSDTITEESSGELVGMSAVPAGNTTIPGSGNISGMIESDLQGIWIYVNTTTQLDFWVLDSNGDYVLDETINDGDDIRVGYGGGFHHAAIWADHGIAYMTSNDAYIVVTRNPGPPDNVETLEEVVVAESGLAGLDSALIEATTLASTIVNGMRIARITTARSIIGSLMSAYWFDMRENGFKLEAVRRGSASQFTVALEDIGAGIDIAETEPVQVERLEDESLPGQIYIGHIDPAADYQWSTQGDRRSAVETDQPSPIEIPLVLTASEAKEIATVLLYMQWIGRTTRTVKVTRKYAEVQPADVGTLETDDGDFLVRTVGVKAAGGLIELITVDEEPALYSPNVAAAAVDRDTTVAGNVPTYFAFMNIPAQRPQDTDAGYYVAATGYTQPWPGARVYESIDGGLSFRSIGFISTPATMGPVPTALGTYAGSLASYDTTSVLTVQFLYGTPQSVTDPEIAAGANKAAVGREDGGWEIIQYKTATFISGNTWELTDLMRGVQGTDAYISTHVDNEKFVLLDVDTLLRISGDISALGVDRSYTVVTTGSQVFNAPSVIFANLGSGLASAPVWKEHVRAATTANITLSGAQTIDGVSIIAGDRVLVKDQSSGDENGIYVAASGAWTRATDADAIADVQPGMATFVSEGTTNGNQGWWLITNAPVVLNTTALVFEQFSGGGLTVLSPDPSGSYLSADITVDAYGRVTAAAHGGGSSGTGADALSEGRVERAQPTKGSAGISAATGTGFVQVAGGVEGTISAATPQQAHYRIVMNTAVVSTVVGVSNTVASRRYHSTADVSNWTSRFYWGTDAAHDNSSGVAVGYCDLNVHTTTPSTAYTNLICMGADGGASPDTNWQIIRRASGAAVKVDTGIARGANQLFRLTIQCISGTGFTVTIDQYSTFSTGWANVFGPAAYTTSIPASSATYNIGEVMRLKTHTSTSASSISFFYFVGTWQMPT